MIAAALLACVAPDRDGDGVPDDRDACATDAEKDAPGVCGCHEVDDDTDGDGLADCDDTCPTNGDPDQVDGDGDGVGDACDTCPTVPDPDQTGDRCACDPHPAACVDGAAAGYPCDDVDLLSFVPLSAFGAVVTSDVWGWVAPDGAEWALVALDVGLGFVDVSNPWCPEVVGLLAARTDPDTWRDVEVVDGFAVVGSEAQGHGLQIFDLHRLADERGDDFVVFEPDAVYDGVGSSHTVTIDPRSRTVAANGSLTCGGGMHFVDLSDPTDPAFAGCFDAAGYVHDAQCVTYHGPDDDHDGAVICVTGNGASGTISVVDATDPSAVVELSRFAYGPDSVRMGGPPPAYAHQGWFDGEQRWFYFGDELDELSSAVTTITYVIDLEDLDAPRLEALVDQEIDAIDHQQFVVGRYLYQSNYAAGLVIHDLTDPTAPVPVARFDVFPTADVRLFVGTWAHYPFLPSRVIPVNSMFDGLFLVRPRLDP